MLCTETGLMKMRHKCCRVPPFEMNLNHLTMATIVLLSASEQAHCALVIYNSE